MATNPFTVRKWSATAAGVALLLFAVLAGTAVFFYKQYRAQQSMIAPIAPYNFTDETVDNLYVNGQWGGNSDAHSGGGTGVCCVMVPKKWHAGLLVQVKWESGGKWYTAAPQIPEYHGSEELQIIFHGNHEVMVYLLSIWPCTPNHPMRKESLCGATKHE